MGEYGRIVGEGSGRGGRGGGPGDVTGDIMAAVQDAIDQVAALPPEVLLVLVAAIAVGGMLLLRR